MIDSGQLYIARSGYVAGEPARVLDVAHAVPDTLDDQCRHVDRTRHVAHVDIEGDAHIGYRVCRRHGMCLQLAPQGTGRVIGDARCDPVYASAETPAFGQLAHRLLKFFRGRFPPRPVFGGTLAYFRAAEYPSAGALG